MTSSPTRGWVLGGGTAVLAVCVLIVAKSVFLSGVEYRRGERYTDQGKTLEAVERYSRAVRWYAPGNIFSMRAVAKLWETGQAFEQVDDPRTALKVYMVLRSSLYAVRNFYQPGKKWIRKADRRITELHELGETREQAENPSPRKGGRDVYWSDLPGKERPGLVWSIIVEAGFWGWVIGVIGFILTAFGKNEGEFFPRKAVSWGVMVLVCYCLWMLGMVRA